MSKLTAVEWLVQQLIPAIALQEKHIDYLAQQAKEMERSQITDAYNQGGFVGFNCCDTTAEQYYTQNYKTD